MKIWVIKVGEPLPWLFDEKDSRFWRAGQLAECLIRRGHNVTFFASKFDHYKKKFRPRLTDVNNKGPDTILLDSRGYKKNISLGRILDHNDLANSFRQQIVLQPSPDLIFVAWPTVELAYAAMQYGMSNNIPVVLDVRDCWPDIIYSKFPKFLDWLPKIILPYDQMARFSFRNAAALTAVSDGILKWAQIKGDRDPLAKKNDCFFYQTQHDRVVSKEDTEFWQQKGVDLFSSNKVRVIWAGSLEPTLDLKTCLCAIENFSTQHDSNIEFIFCGRGSMEPKILDLEAKINNFLFAGQVGDHELKALLSRSNIGFMCYPDRFDFHASIPNKVVDFCMAGMRVITNLDGELSSLMASSEILRYKSGDHRSLEDVLLLVSKNFKIFLTKSNKNRLLYEREFSASSVLPRFCEYLESMIKSNNK